MASSLSLAADWDMDDRTELNWIETSSGMYALESFVQELEIFGRFCLFCVENLDLFLGQYGILLLVCC